MKKTEINRFAQNDADRPARKISSATKDCIAQSIQELFARTATRFPDREAVVDDQGSWSYRELARQAELYATHFRSLTSDPFPRALILASQSRETLAVALGALLSGWSFACIDNSYTESLIKGAIERIRPAAIVHTRNGPPMPTLSQTQSDMPVYITASDIPAQDHAPGWLDNHQPVPGGSRTEIAQITFTSGSTGFPKAVAIAHQDYVNLLERWIDLYDIVPEDRIAVQSTFMYDGFLDALVAAAAGATAIIVPEGIYFDGDAWAKYLRGNRVTSLMAVPAAMQLALGSLSPTSLPPRLRRLILIGEACSAHIYRLIDRKLPRNLRIHNSFGISEALLIMDSVVDRSHPVITTSFPPPDRENVPWKLVDDDGADISQKIGATGSLLVAPPGIFTGYVGDDGTVSSHQNDQGYYDTRDLFRVLPDHSLKYLGRKDRRLKWAGYRIEPTEIELAALSVPGVIAARCTITSSNDLQCEVTCDKTEGSMLVIDQIKKAFTEFLPISYSQEIRTIETTVHILSELKKLR
tara:strand:+ start:3224 stop:4798 length:1575 start_codon:yes stop_codon:yes gene_type:complete